VQLLIPRIVCYSVNVHEYTIQHVYFNIILIYSQYFDVKSIYHLLGCVAIQLALGLYAEPFFSTLGIFGRKKHLREYPVNRQCFYE